MVKSFVEVVYEAPRVFDKIYLCSLSQQKVMGYSNPKILVKIPATQVTHIVGNNHP